MVRLSWLLPALLAMLLFACGDDDGNGSTVTVRTPTSPPTATQPAGDTPTSMPTDEPTDEPTDAPTLTPTTVPPQPTPTTPQRGGDGAVVLPCNDIRAPVDKEHRLPADCVPQNLVALPSAYVCPDCWEQLLTAEAADAFIEMREAAAADGYELFARSSYRSYDTQAQLYNNYVNTHGQAEADRFSARPGHSEHQLGTTTDVTAASAGYQLDPFVGTQEAAWVEGNSWRYGFIVSYPEGMESVTGYIYEPWHLRYVGLATAADVRASGLTLGEYLHEVW